MAVKTSSTLVKALDILEVLSDAGGELSATEVAGATGFDRATCYRLLVTYAQQGYVIHDTESKRFKLGYKVVSLARGLLQEDKEVESLREVMRLIAQRSTETCHYSILDGDRTVITLREKGKQLVSVDFAVGDVADLHCTAGGKAMLAFADIRFVQEYLSRKRVRHTANTLVDSGPLRKELIEIRAHGVSYDNEELIAGLRCLAAPIFEADGSVKSTIAMSGPSTRYTDERIAELEVILREGARELTRRRGGPRWSI